MPPLDGLLVSYCPDVLTSETGAGATVVVAPTDGGYYALEGIALRIWELLTPEARPAVEILDRLLLEYDTPRERLAEDLAEFLSDMGRRGLVRVTGGA